MMPMVESMAVMPVSVLMRFGLDDEILALPQPAANRPVMTAWWHFARAQALARGGRIDEAAAEERSVRLCMRASVVALIPMGAFGCCVEYRRGNDLGGA